MAWLPFPDLIHVEVPSLTGIWYALYNLYLWETAVSWMETERNWGWKQGGWGNGGEDLKGEDEGRLLPGYKINWKIKNKNKTNKQIVLHHCRPVGSSDLAPKPTRSPSDSQLRNPCVILWSLNYKVLDTYT